MFDMSRKAFFSSLFILVTVAVLLLRQVINSRIIASFYSFTGHDDNDVQESRYGKRAADALKSKNETIIKEKSLMLFLERQV